MTGVILLGVFADIHNGESRFDFRCDAKGGENDQDFIRGKCFEQYEKRYNNINIPVYGFVIINFSLIGVVCAIYSHTVKSRASELEESNADVELGHQDQIPRRGLFFAYHCHLATRLALAILLTVLQTQLFYPTNFPSDFNCNLQASREGRHVVNASANIQNMTQTFECHNQRATKKTFWNNAVSVINGGFALVTLIEFFYLLWRARRNDFTEDSHFFKVYLQSKPGGSELDRAIGLQKNFFDEVKKRIREGTRQLPQLRSPFPSYPGEERTSELQLDDIYTNLMVKTGRVTLADLEVNRRKQSKVHPDKLENLSPKKPEDIIDAKNKNVLIIGRPGIGKTLLCEKLMRDWANGKAFSHQETKKDGTYFCGFFLFRFRRFNSAENRRPADINLRELLTLSEYFEKEALDDEVYNLILRNTTKILLMFDGLDEFEDKSNIAKESQYEDSKTEKMPLSALYGKLASGKLLHGATILTTTRPTAVSKVRYLSFDKTVEIVGFSSKQVEEYVENFSKAVDSSAGETIMRHISNNMNLFTLCYIPVNCFIVCLCLLQVLKFRAASSLRSISLPTTLTEIYKKTVKIFFFKHNSKYRYELSEEEFESDDLPDDVQVSFKKLGEIAFKGIKEGRLIFGSSEVKGLEESELFYQLPRHHSDAFKTEKQFCFIHLTMQEFFAAKHIVDTMDGEELTRFISNHISDGTWEVVFQFLAGLLRDREDRPVGIFTNLLPSSTERRTSASQNECDKWQITPLQDDSDDQHTLSWWPTGEADITLAQTICKCIYEYHDLNPEVIGINFNAVDFSNRILTPVDCTALVYLLQNLKEFSCLKLTNNRAGPLCCVEIAKLFGKNNFSKLAINGNGVANEGVKHLCDAFRELECNLTELALINNNITDSGVEELSEIISNGNCQLRELNLSGNNISHRGARHLYIALSQKKCKLSLLDLSDNTITDVGIEYLSLALVCNNCSLRSLNLAENNITDSGVKNLSEAIAYGGCKLNALNLSQIQITDEGVKHISKALAASNCRIRRLTLSRNYLTDEGLKHLSEALSDGNCRLRYLNLRSSRIRDKGVKFLSDAVTCNCKLRELNLSRNLRMTDQALKFLSEALSCSSCNLSVLTLSRTSWMTDDHLTPLYEAGSHSNCKVEVIT